ncbi:MAG: RluA family pseudouridine synthase [Eubacteriales bacterium]|nr:RluA family pseudouridine synthase [Eubacteriales bacterium]
MIKFIIDNTLNGIRTDKFLQKILPNAPISLIYKQIRNNNIEINHSKCKYDNILKKGDVVEIFISDETYLKFSSKIENNYSNKKIDISKIIFEDDNIILYNKPLNVLSQKSKKEDISLNELLYDYNNKYGSVLNRLDRNTTGIIIFGKNYLSSREISNMIKAHNIEKHYHALCFGLFKIKEDILEAYLFKDKKNNKSIISNNYSSNSKKIITKYKVLKENASINISLLDVQLITGASHQIRSHLSFYNHQIVGDIKYNNKSNNFSKNQIDFLNKIKKTYGKDSYCLHSYSITFGEFNNKSLNYLSNKIFRTNNPEWESFL